MQEERGVLGYPEGFLACASQPRRSVRGRAFIKVRVRSAGAGAAAGDSRPQEVSPWLRPATAAMTALLSSPGGSHFPSAAAIPAAVAVVSPHFSASSASGGKPRGTTMHKVSSPVRASMSMAASQRDVTR